MNNLEIIKEKFKDDQFAQKFGIELDDVDETSVKMHMALDATMANFFDRIHGGAMYALADAAFSVIGNNCNCISVAIECSISYHTSPEVGQVLHVEGHEVSGSSKIGTYLFSLFTEEDDGGRTAIATMKSTLYKTGQAHRAGMSTYCWKSS